MADLFVLSIVYKSMSMTKTRNCTDNRIYLYELGTETQSQKLDFSTNSVTIIVIMTYMTVTYNFVLGLLLSRSLLREINYICLHYGVTPVGQIEFLLRSNDRVITCTNSWSGGCP